MTEIKPSYRLKRPPIEEVVCGFIFKPLPLDAVDFGVYWHQRSDEFPHKQLRSALLENVSSVDLDAPLTRTWLISELQDFVLQLQSDRFYMNWRRGEGEYPRFSDRHDKVGLKTKALSEYQKFAQFCTAHITETPDLQRVELTKIDILRQEVHYRDADDLGKMLKVARVFEDIQAAPATQLQLRLTENRDEGSVHVAITTAPDFTKIETRALVTPGPDLDRSLYEANRRINDIFFGLLDDESLDRFNQEIIT